MNCKFCGFELMDQSNFCQNCGQLVNATKKILNRFDGTKDFENIFNEQKLKKYCVINENRLLEIKSCDFEILHIPQGIIEVLGLSVGHKYTDRYYDNEGGWDEMDLDYSNSYRGNLRAIFFPKSVKVINMHNHITFGDCTEVYFSNGVEEILNGFSLMKIKKIFIPRSVKKIGIAAFTWSSIEEIWLDYNNHNFILTNDTFYSRDGRLIYWSEKDEITLSSETKIGYLKNKVTFSFDESVTQIACQYNDNIYNLINRYANKIRIPKTVTYIGFDRESFGNHILLKNITVDLEDNHPTYIQVGPMLFNKSKYEMALKDNSKLSSKKMDEIIKNYSRQTFFYDNEIKKLQEYKKIKFGIDNSINVPIIPPAILHLNPDVIINNIGELYLISTVLDNLIDENGVCKIKKDVYYKHTEFFQQFILKNKNYLHLREGRNDDYVVINNSEVYIEIELFTKKINIKEIVESNLDKIIIPRSLTEIVYDDYIGTLAKEHHPKYIEVEPNNEHYFSELGSVYSIEGSELIFTGYHPYVYTLDKLFKDIRTIGAFSCVCYPFPSRLLISEGIIEIKNRAFYSNSSLVDIVLPKSLKLIGEWAFAFCSELVSVTINSKVRFYDAFSFHGSSLKQLILNDIPRNLDIFMDNDFLKKITICVKKDMFNEFSNMYSHMDIKVNILE